MEAITDQLKDQVLRGVWPVFIGDYLWSIDIIRSLIDYSQSVMDLYYIYQIST